MIPSNSDYTTVENLCSFDHHIGLKLQKHIMESNLQEILKFSTLKTAAHQHLSIFTEAFT